MVLTRKCGNDTPKSLCLTFCYLCYCFLHSCLNCPHILFPVFLCLSYLAFYNFSIPFPMLIYLMHAICPNQVFICFLAVTLWVILQNSLMTPYYRYPCVCVHLNQRYSPHSSDKNVYPLTNMVDVLRLDLDVLVASICQRVPLWSCMQIQIVFNIILYFVSVLNLYQNTLKYTYMLFWKLW